MNFKEFPKDDLYTMALGGEVEGYTPIRDTYLYGTADKDWYHSVFIHGGKYWEYAYYEDTNLGSIHLSPADPVQVRPVRIEIIDYEYVD